MKNEVKGLVNLDDARLYAETDWRAGSSITDSHPMSTTNKPTRCLPTDRATSTEKNSTVQHSTAQWGPSQCHDTTRPRLGRD
jgi:hypothetical protein